MSTGADVRSLAQLKNLRERCMHSRVQTLKEAEGLQAELNKLSRWLVDEAAPYWQNQFVLSERRLNECRDALTRCQATVRADEKRPCSDERKRLEIAMTRRTLCEEKLRAVRDAGLVWQAQVVKLRGRLQHVGDMAEGHLMVTLYKLDEIIATLETYAQIQSPPKQAE